MEKLSPLPFRLKYTHSSHVIPSARTTTTTATTNQRPSSLLPKRFNVRAWLRDRKTQVKISPKEPQAPAPPPPPPSSQSSVPSSSIIGKSPSSTIVPPSKSTSSKSSTIVPPPPPPNVSLRRKLGSIPVPKRHQTVH